MYVNLLFWYQFFCGFSGSVMTNSWVLIFFNLLFTSVPPLIYGILDQDMSADTLRFLPELYQAAQTSKVSTHTTYLTQTSSFKICSDRLHCTCELGRLLNGTTEHQSSILRPRMLLIQMT